MSGVFEALVATAVGLFVAIPAVVAYNLFQRRVRKRMAEVDSLAHLILSTLRYESARPVARRNPPEGPDEGRINGRQPDPRVMPTNPTARSATSTSRRWSTSCWCC